MIPIVVLATVLVAEPNGADTPGTPILNRNSQVEQELAADKTDSYQVDLQAGGLLLLEVEQLGIDVVLTALAPDEQVAAEADVNGHSVGSEFLRVGPNETGRYGVKVRAYPDNPQSGCYRLRVHKLLNQEEGTAYRVAGAEQRAAVEEWVSKTAVPFATVSPRSGFDDMLGVKAVIGDARVVALGEATHGTREFFQLKHRMLEFLVNEMGFTAFAMEASLPEAFDIDQLVLTGEGDPAAALRGLYFWIWNTEEALDLVRWIKNYNADPSHLRKVRFYGFDIQYESMATQRALKYLERVDPNFWAQAVERLGEIADPFLVRSFRVRPEEQRRASATFLSKVLERFDENKAEYTGATGPTEWALARQHARVAQQAILNRIEPDLRDESMAENILWILDQEGEDGKLVVWAHNGHVGTEAGRMGGYLRDSLGTDLVSLGFVFNRGSFRAMDSTQEGRLREIEVGNPPETDLGATLARAGVPLGLLDLRQLPPGSAAFEWFHVPQTYRHIGASYYPDWQYYLMMVSEQFDGLLFVEQTSAARGYTQFSGRPASLSLADPTNPNFEEGGSGEVPPGWVFDGRRNFGFRVVTTDDCRSKAGKCTVVTRQGNKYGAAFGGIKQVVKADTYHGRKVVMRSSVKVAAEGTASKVHLYVRTRGGGPPLTETRTIMDRDWNDHSVEIDVPDSARSLEFGLLLVGQGSAWIDSVSLVDRD